MKHFLFLTLFLSLSLGALAQGVPAGIPDDGGQTNEETQFQDDQVKEQKLLIPNAFTPNGDGVNDIYYVENSNFSEFEFSIFDRWGNQLFYSIEPNFRWNGEINGRKLPAGIYVFVFNGTTNQGQKVKQSGTISVIY